MSRPAAQLRLPPVPAPPPDQGFSPAMPLELDRSARSLRGGLLLTGGDPPHVMRLSTAGREAVRTMQSGSAADTPAVRALARRLTDAGLMHPRPCPVSDESIASTVTVVIPVRDRPAELSRCLTTLASGPPRPLVIVVDDGSTDRAKIAEICHAHSTQLIQLEESRGPAAARNAAIPQVRTKLTAFLDSDCIPDPDWLTGLVGHFTDPLVGAAAPRIRGIAPGARTAVARHAAAHAPIDLGPRPARVAPQQRVSYIPTAALLVRTAALGSGFDPGLRYGEDVDLVWRLHGAGWRVRYDPTVTVRHTEPATWMRLVKRRFNYGTSAAPLATRHPGRLSPLIISPWPAAATLAALAGKPLTTAAITACQIQQFGKHLGDANVPLTEIMRWTVHGTTQTFLATGKTATTLAPWLLAAGLTNRPTRNASLALLLAPPVVEWMLGRPPLDPFRWTVLTVADNVAFGIGVWSASLSTRSWDAVRPQLLTRH